ncbi:MAG: 50S ribosomal protein L13 [Chlamydiae bacterium]|nr:50S ribosomal protein L13 [Chlamydiota bacterium]MBI3265807.1 50S ribosomal protein L13 [Chlamydiota bacterium]
MKTYVAKIADGTRKWFLVDAQDKILGRLSVNIADLLRGKRKPIFTPHVDCGDFVVVINAEKVKVTGKKEEQIIYKTASGYPGGQKRIPYEKVKREHPERIIEHAVKGMLPANRLGRAVLKKLKIYAGEIHPHAAQKPEKIEL